jgi:hypothetical protein
MFKSKHLRGFNPLRQKQSGKSRFPSSDDCPWLLQGGRRQRPRIAEEPTIDGWEPTPAPGPSPEQSNYHSADRILLRLDKPPEDPTRGRQFGTNPRVCDYLLGHRGVKGISSCQFSITITQSFWVELHDKSRYGTCVSHDGQAKHVVVKDDRRLLSYEPGSRNQWEEVILYVPDIDGLASSQLPEPPRRRM